MRAKMKNPLEVFESAKTSGGLIKAFRENFSIEQDDMAYACEMSQANHSAIDNGRRKVGPTVALKLSAFMGISPLTILYPKGFELQREFVTVQKRKARLFREKEKAAS